jgi:hypothetical protein
MATLAGVVCGVLLATAAVSSCRAAEPLTFLHARGQDMVNEKGEKVLLRGVGLGNWMLPEGYMWKFGGQYDRPRRIEKLVSDLIGSEEGTRFWAEFRKSYVAEADIRRIAELGYNSVRPALNSRLFLGESEPPVPVEEGFALLDNLVRWCKANGVYVIIDMHGAPGGQTGQNIDDSADDRPELFMQAKYQDRLVDLWTTLARRYKDEPVVAGYDLLNEPLPERTGAAAKYRHLLEPLYQRITKAIRQVDAKHMIVLEGVDWANDWSVFTKPFDSNLVYQFHYYCWDSPTQLKSISRYLDFRQRFNAPVWVGETGERDNLIYWATMEYFEANNIGWSFWPWKKLDAGNAPYSIKAPARWKEIVGYTHGGTKPEPAVARAAFSELLGNLRLENCVFYPAVVNAMLRRVPARIEGENYGQGGVNVSYSVADSSRRSANYRTNEPVPVVAGEPGRRWSVQYISLSAEEWTAYSIDSLASQGCAVTIRVRAEKAPAEAQVVVGEQVLDIKIPSEDWSELKLGPVTLERGINRIRWVVRRGTVDLDWLDVNRTEPDLQSVNVRPMTTAGGS